MPCSGEKPLKPAPRPPTLTTVTLAVATVATATSATAGRAVFWPNRKCGSSRCGPPYAPSRPANHSVVSLDLPWEDRLCLAAWAKVPFSSVIPKQGSFSFEPTPTIDLSQHPSHPSHPSSNDSSIVRSFDCSPRAAAVPVSRPRPRPRLLLRSAPVGTPCSPPPRPNTSSPSDRGWSGPATRPRRRESIAPDTPTLAIISRMVVATCPPRR